MSWTDQNPEAIDVLLQGWVMVKDQDVAFEIDRLATGEYRATVGNLFGSEEIHRDDDLAHCLRLFSMSIAGLNPNRKLA